MAEGSGQAIEFTEKQRRVYYQGIVYEVCNLIDRAAGRSIGTGTVSGTVAEPSDDIKRTLSGLLGELADLRHQSALRDDAEEERLLDVRESCADVAESFHKGQSEPYQGDRRNRGRH